MTSCLKLLLVVSSLVIRRIRWCIYKYEKVNFSCCFHVFSLPSVSLPVGLSSALIAKSCIEMLLTQLLCCVYLFTTLCLYRLFCITWKISLSSFPLISSPHCFINSHSSSSQATVCGPTYVRGGIEGDESEPHGAAEPADGKGHHVVPQTLGQDVPAGGREALRAGTTTSACVPSQKVIREWFLYFST